MNTENQEQHSTTDLQTQLKFQVDKFVIELATQEYKGRVRDVREYLEVL